MKISSEEELQLCNLTQSQEETNYFLYNTSKEDDNE